MEELKLQIASEAFAVLTHKASEKGLTLNQFAIEILTDHLRKHGMMGDSPTINS
jgi:hypothetical protein